jgi:hypothetical protein
MAAAATAAAMTDAERIAELEKKVEALSRDVETVRLGDLAPPVGEGKYGLGPGASKIYFQKEGVSIGGYGEAVYQNFDSSEKTDEWDFLRAVLYTGYKFSDKLILNTEIEIEHAADDQEGEVAVEFAYLDYLARREINFRAGLLLVPVGLISELHEPTTFLSARRPDVESRIIPSTWRENGVGLFGDVAGFSYKAYLMNGFDAEGFTASGLRGGRQKGSKAEADDLAGVLRIDYTAAPGLIAGGSVYYGNSGQDLEADVSTLIYEAHVDFKRGGWDLRALAVAAELDDVAELNGILSAELEDPTTFSSVGERMVGGYVQAGYDILNLIRPGEMSLTPFVRLEAYNTQDEVPDGYTASAANDVELLTIGLNFKPNDQVVAKAEYQIYDDAGGKLPDQWNLAMGYVF